MPIESGPAQVSASGRLHSPTGSRARLIVRSALMKVQCLKDRKAEVPLQKSAAMVARISGEIGSPSTMGREARYQIDAGPGLLNAPLTFLISRPDRKGVLDMAPPSASVPSSGRDRSSGGKGRS